MQLPPSTVSRHLKAPSEGLGRLPRGGHEQLYTKRVHRRRPDASMRRARHAGPSARRLWLLVREQGATTRRRRPDQRRLQVSLGEPRTKSQEFFSAAGQWVACATSFAGIPSFDGLAALIEVIGRRRFGLLGGGGQVSVALAPFATGVVRSIVGRDAQAARKRPAGSTTSIFGRGDSKALPIEDERLDAATLMLVLHHVAEPGQALAEVARVLKPGGRVLVVDMLPHDRESYRQQMGHVWLGFAEDHVQRMLDASEFEEIRIIPLATGAKTKGPGLFVATGRKREAPRKPEITR